MRKNYFITAIGMFLLYSCSALQKQTSSINEKQTVKTIEWDYYKKNFVESKVYNNLMVNDIIQVKLINVPENYFVQSEVNFQNQHLEMQGKFGQFIQFDTNNPSNFEPKNTPITPEAIQDTLNKKNEQINKESTKAVVDSLALNDNSKGGLKSKVNKESIILNLNRRKKIDYNTLQKALEIEIAKKFIEKQKDNNEAIGDIKWQSYLIKIAQKNWEGQIKYRDSLIKDNIDRIQKLEILNKNKDRKLEEVGKGTTVYLLPVKIQNYDYSIFTTSIRSKNTQEELVLNMPFRNKGGVKIDFSSGVLLNGLYSTSYMLIKQDNENSIIKEETDKTSKFNTGISILAHVYKRGNEFNNYAISSGFSYNLNQQNINFLLGGSVLFGSEQRFIFTGGINVGRVSQLANYYQTDKLYKTTDFGTDSKVPMVNVLKASWFVGISYNLGINKSSSKVKL